MNNFSLIVATLANGDGIDFIIFEFYNALKMFNKKPNFELLIPVLNCASDLKRLPSIFCLFPNSSQQKRSKKQLSHVSSLKLLKELEFIRILFYVLEHAVSYMYMISYLDQIITSHSEIIQFKFTFLMSKLFRFDIVLEFVMVRLKIILRWALDYTNTDIDLFLKSPVTSWKIPEISNICRVLATDILGLAALHIMNPTFATMPMSTPYSNGRNKHEKNSSEGRAYATRIVKRSSSDGSRSGKTLKERIANVRHSNCQ
ncbi:hypothetical protein AGLY_009941 [Aphis glycines]|uniref:Uncharacterized protein n=1 Tax=Aphis glycines TaxID=307491 RepID=A0A6G0TI84_APHGL|nr:hypothetical protein AGLY_009941 [Aphis glycines]